MQFSVVEQHYIDTSVNVTRINDYLNLIETTIFNHAKAIEDTVFSMAFDFKFPQNPLIVNSLILVRLMEKTGNVVYAFRL